jgi:hypothetical protein
VVLLYKVRRQIGTPKTCTDEHLVLLRFVESFSFDDYQQWKANKTQASEGSQHGATATSGAETPMETSTATTANGEQVTVPPKLTFQQIVEMIETGQEIPGKITDKWMHRGDRSDRIEICLGTRNDDLTCTTLLFAHPMGGNYRHSTDPG